MPFHPATTLSAFDPVPPDPRGEPESLTRLRHEYGAKLRRLEETVLSLDNLLSPQDWLDAGDGFPAGGGWRVNRPAQRTQDRTHAPLSYLNEEEWRYHVAVARDLVTRNHLALGFRDHVCGFLGSVSVSFVLRGHEPGASAPGGSLDPLVRAASAAWAEWRELAEWGEGEEDREEECRRRLIVEGESTLRFFVGDEATNGLPVVRHIEPELIRTPPGSSTADPAGWGVVTHPDDDEREEGLWVCDPADVSRGRVVASSEYVRVKANTDRTVKRGLSDFLPVGDQLRKVLGLLDNMAHVARLQAAIAWWEQYPTATLDQVVSQVRLGADYQRPKLPPTSSGTGTEVTSYEPGTVVRTEGGREVKPGPVASGIAGFESVERMVLRGIGFRWGCPSYFSGEGDASFASVLVTGSPFVRVVTARQQKLKGFARAVAGRFVEFCERSGRLPAGASRRLRAVATAEPVVMADEEKQARTFLSLYAQNCADPVEFIRSRGGDPAVVAANIRAWKQKFAPPAPGGGGGPGGAGMTPAPPGSAGGDGSSPNVLPVGESRSKPCGCQEPVRESTGGGEPGDKKPGFTGDTPDAAGHHHCFSNGKPVACPDKGEPSADGSDATAGDSPSTGGATASATKLPRDHLHNFLKDNGFTPGADVAKMPEPALVKRYITVELTNKLRALTGNDATTVESVLTDPSHPYHEDLGEVVLAAIVGGEKGNGQPIDVAHHFADKTGQVRKLALDNKMAASNSDRRHVLGHHGGRLKTLQNVTATGHVLITVGFNPDGKDADGKDRTGALVGRFGTGVSNWPVEDGPKAKLAARKELSVLTKFDSLNQLWDTGIVEAQSNIRAMVEGFDMDEYTELTGTEARALGGKLANGSDRISVAAREGMLDNISEPEQVKDAVAKLSGKLSDSDRVAALSAGLSVEAEDQLLAELLARKAGRQPGASSANPPG